MTARLLLSATDHEPLPDGSTWAEWAQWAVSTEPPAGPDPLTAQQALLGSDGPALPVDAPEQLELVRRWIARKLRAWQRSGVVVWDPARVWLGPLVEAEATVVVGPDVVLLGETRLAAGAVIEERCSLRSSRVGPGARIRAGSVLEGAEVGPGAQVGPLAHLRPGALLEEGAKVGNFVEVKSTRLGRGAKASHLTYLGDAEVGPGANIGAGTITCNYDGFSKHRTRIGAGAFIGSNTALVAPVDVGEGALVGAGSVIVADVPAGAVALGRAEQRTREGAAARIRERQRQRADRKERP